MSWWRRCRIAALSAGKSLFWPAAASHCCIIREHMQERGGGGVRQQLPIKHHDRKSLECHRLMSRLPIICVGLQVCTCVFLNLNVRSLICVRVRLLSEHICQSRISQREACRWGEKEEKNRKNRGSESHRCLRFLLVCLQVFSIQKHNVEQPSSHSAHCSSF